ncbi:MAG TPA: ATP-binding cassette domain-containing protein [Propionibacteriaceae bacterium]|nr:ATP-binding cassette domain-containing protein [Propionibacteriaceae bacterium]
MAKERNNLSFDVMHGSITGFLGPDGAGKTTTLRMLLGLVHPTAGTALVDGSPYHRLDRPGFTVGAALEAAGADAARRRVGGFTVGMRQRLMLVGPPAGAAARRSRSPAEQRLPSKSAEPRQVAGVLKNKPAACRSRLRHGSG